jgi:protein SCO1/2
MGMQVLSSRRELAITLSVMLVIAAAIGFAVAAMLPGTPASTSSSRGALIGGPFELTNHRGEPVTEATFAGRHMLIYFGYAYCPDICPTSLQTMAGAYDLLTADEKEKVRPIFITVDPERDDVAAMNDYVTLFDEDLIGLTGSLEQTDAAAKAYRVYHAKAFVEEGSEDYFVDHSSFYYLMGPDGAYVRHFGHDTTEEEMAEGIRESLD